MSPYVARQGEGSFLKIYNANDENVREAIFIKKIFKGRKIHKLKVFEYENDEKQANVGVLSGRYFCLLNIQLIKSTKTISVKHLTKPKCFKDWIWDISLLRQTDNLWFAFITAHNVVFKWNWKTNEEVVVSKCSEECILYSAQFYQPENGNLVVAAGTVFNQILIWVPCLSPKSNEIENVEVQSRLIGHQGVIFYMQFSNDGQKLLSVSDDCSIRLWNTNTNDCVRTMFGHHARVWKALFAEEYIVSIGEDSKCIIWNAEGDVFKILQGHKGKGIWSLTINRNGTQIATGGGDASIRLYSFRALVHSSDDIVNSDKINQMSLEMPHKEDSMTSKQHDYPRFIHFINNRSLLVHTNKGLTYHVSSMNSIDGNSGINWLLLCEDCRYGSYSCIAINTEKRIVAIGNLDGYVKVYWIDYPDHPAEIKAHSGKVFSIQWLSSFRKDIYYLLTCGPDGVLHTWHIQWPDTKDLSIVQVNSLILPYCRQRWNTCSVLVKSSSGQILVCGDRRGSVHAFKFADNATEPASPCHSLLGLHGKTGITSIIEHNGVLYTTGRDGTFKKLSINKEDQITLIETKKVCSGFDWLDHIIFEGDDVIVAGFYQQSYFALWSLNKNEMIFKCECGGGYRSWDIFVPQKNLIDENPAMFTFMKGEIVRICKFQWKKSNWSSQRILQESLHGREANCITYLGKHTDGECKTYLLATGSEDTTINVLSYDPSDLEQLKCSSTITGHVGAVKSIISTNCQSNDRITTTPEFYVTCGSRSSLKCWQANVAGCSAGQSVMMEWTQLAEIRGTTNKMLKQKMETGTDLRFIDACVFDCGDLDGFQQNDSGLYVIGTACSDGKLRIFGFDRKQRSFDLLHVNSFHERCVLVARKLLIPTTKLSNCCIIITSATDGRYAFWDVSNIIRKYVDYKNKTISDDEDSIPDKSDNVCRLSNFSKDISQLQVEAIEPVLAEEPMMCLSAHQSGVNAIDFKLKDDLLQVVSGGDDNSITLHNIKVSINDKEINLTTQNFSMNSSAHHSSVTGMAMIGHNHIISSSVDQTIKIWHHDSKSTPSWQMMMKYELDVSDISALAVWHDESKLYLAVCGAGVQVFAIENEDWKEA